MYEVSPIYSGLNVPYSSGTTPVPVYQVTTRPAHKSDVYNDKGKIPILLVKVEDFLGREIPERYS